MSASCRLLGEKQTCAPHLSRVEIDRQHTWGKSTADCFYCLLGRGAAITRIFSMKSSAIGLSDRFLAATNRMVLREFGNSTGSTLRDENWPGGRSANSGMTVR